MFLFIVINLLPLNVQCLLRRRRYKAKYYFDFSSTSSLYYNSAGDYSRFSTLHSVCNIDLGLLYLNLRRNEDFSIQNYIYICLNGPRFALDLQSLLPNFKPDHSHWPRCPYGHFPVNSTATALVTRAIPSLARLVNTCLCQLVYVLSLIHISIKDC